MNKSKKSKKSKKILKKEDRQKYIYYYIMNNDDFNEEKQNKFKEELKTQFEPYEQIINEDKEFIHEAFEN